MFDKTKKVLLSFSIVLCLMATFIASNRPAPVPEQKIEGFPIQKASYASVVISFEGKTIQFGLKVSTSN
ncbi:MAG TPA: hypothetical protein PLO84_13260 [Thermotogota bacterium]|nr:hypothetical protein [Thermotogota bacterium]